MTRWFVATLLGLGCYGQSLSLTPSSSSPAGAVSFDVILTGATTMPAVAQWTLNYPSTSVTGVTAVPGPASSGAGKTVTCASGNCVLYGFDGQTVTNGVIAVVVYQVAGGSSVASSSFQLSSSLGASAAGDPVGLALSNTAISVTTSGLPGASIGVPYSASLSASGGSGSYTWSLASGALPAGLTLNSDGSITGAPTAAAVTSSFAVEATDTSNSQVTAVANFTIAIAAVNPITLSLSGSQAAGQQPTLNIAGSGTNGVALNGTLALTFTSAVNGYANDPNIQFVQSGASSGSRQVMFTVPALSAAGAFTNGITKVATGTVAGTITITTTSLTDANGNTVTAPPPLTIAIAAAAPVITNVTASSSNGTLTVNVTGFSTTRDLQSLTFNFVPTSGTTLTQSSVAVNVNSPFATYYSGTASQAFGSQFVATVPFTFSNATAPVAALTVNATNSQGTSAASNSVSP